MKITSLSRMTDLIFGKFNGTVEDKGNYMTIKTPSNPGYHWGNYIIFDRAPQKGDYDKWVKLFKTEFDYYNPHTHMVFSWNPQTPGDYDEFVSNGFEFDEGVVLVATAEDIVKPPKFNEEISIEKLDPAKVEDFIELQYLCADPKYREAGYRNFKVKQMDQYLKMTEANMGSWFGAYLDGKLVGDLGLFHENGVGRFQNVGTHPDHRRKGICGALVYHVAKLGLSTWNIESLVMEADASYHAAQIYENIGFKPVEKNYALSWWTSHD